VSMVWTKSFDFFFLHTSATGVQQSRFRIGKLSAGSVIADILVLPSAQGHTDTQTHRHTDTHSQSHTSRPTFCPRSHTHTQTHSVLRCLLENLYSCMCVFLFVCVSVFFFIFFYFCVCVSLGSVIADIRLLQPICTHTHTYIHTHTHTHTQALQQER